MPLSTTMRTEPVPHAEYSATVTAEEAKCDTPVVAQILEDQQLELCIIYSKDTAKVEKECHDLDRGTTQVDETHKASQSKMQTSLHATELVPSEEVRHAVRERIAESAGSTPGSAPGSDRSDMWNHCHQPAQHEVDDPSMYQQTEAETCTCGLTVKGQESDHFEVESRICGDLRRTTDLAKGETREVDVDTIIEEAEVNAAEGMSEMHATFDLSAKSKVDVVALDSASTHCVLARMDYFVAPDLKGNGRISTIAGQIGKVKQGRAQLQLESGFVLDIPDAMYVPTTPRNLLSLRSVRENGCHIATECDLAGRELIRVVKDGCTLATFYDNGRGLYLGKMSPVTRLALVNHA